MKNIRITVFFTIIISALTISVFAQTKKRNSVKPVPKPTATVQPPQEEVQLDVTAAPKTSGKKNERPGDGKETNSATSISAENAPVYFYEFSQPNFTVSSISIELDENGKGKITFTKQSFSGSVSDPVNLSAESLEKLKTLYQNLHFLDSTENYQYEKDYSHLGNMKFTLKQGGRERTAAFNWTDNKDAKALADEYRKIANQYIWLFDFSVARENQPLETPRLMDSLDSLIRRNEINDVSQMIPYLKALADDERIPLISRNHATRLVQQFEKQTAKKM